MWMNLLLYFSILILITDSGALKSTVSRIETPRGPRTINCIETTIKTNPQSVLSKLKEFRLWSKWISPASQFRGDIPIFSKVGDSCEEVFGLFESSQITWTVKEINSNSLIVYSSASKGTFGWDTLELDFKLNPSKANSNEKTTQLQFTYSWTVPNPIVSYIEKLIICKSMMDDNEGAIKRFTELCENL